MIFSARARRWRCQIRPLAWAIQRTASSSSVAFEKIGPIRAAASRISAGAPAVKKAIGSDWTMAAWRGFVAPKGIPTEARDKLAAAIRKVATSKEYNDFMASRGFGVVYAGPEDFAKFMAKSDAELGATMKAVGIVK